jgi:hypothetical protein
MRNYTDISVSEHLSSQIIFSDARVVQSLVFSVVLCGPLFLFLFLSCWPLYIYSPFLTLLITAFISSNFYKKSLKIPKW